MSARHFSDLTCKAWMGSLILCFLGSILMINLRMMGSMILIIYIYIYWPYIPIYIYPILMGHVSHSSLIVSHISFLYSYQNYPWKTTWIALGNLDGFPSTGHRQRSEPQKKCQSSGLRGAVAKVMLKIDSPWFTMIGKSMSIYISHT